MNKYAVKFQRISITCGLLVLFFIMRVSDARATPTSRSEVVKALRAAEASRSNYRIVIETPHRPGKIPSDLRGKLRMRTSVNGMTRTQKILPSVQDPTGYSGREVSAWNGEEMRVLLRDDEVLDEGHPATLVITANKPPNWYLDFVEMSLGLSATPLHLPPSKVIENSSNRIRISEVDREGTTLVEVKILELHDIPGELDTLRFDPDRNWLMVELETKYYAKNEDGSLGKLAFSGSSRVLKAEIIDGVWMPRVIESENIWPKSSGNYQNSGKSITELHKIELNPVVDESFFNISSEGLPNGSTIADGRLGISYRLGDDHIYMDGRLHKVTSPITSEITADMLPGLMADSTPVIDPDDANPTLRSVRSDIPWSRYGMIGFLGLGVLGIGFIIRRRMQG